MDAVGSPIAVSYMLVSTLASAVTYNDSPLSLNEHLLTIRPAFVQYILCIQVRASVLRALSIHSSFTPLSFNIAFMFSLR
eukprot:886877-Pyramimonas_sp.AAC.1